CKTSGCSCYRSSPFLIGMTLFVTSGRGPRPERRAQRGRLGRRFRDGPERSGSLAEAIGHGLHLGALGLGGPGVGGAGGGGGGGGRGPGRAGGRGLGGVAAHRGVMRGCVLNELV